MTALAAGLALVPLVVAGRIPGHEIEYPMAIVILGGLVTSTLLNLFVVPSLYLRFGRACSGGRGAGVMGGGFEVGSHDALISQRHRGMKQSWSKRGR